MDDLDKKAFAIEIYAVAEMCERKVSKELLLMYFNSLIEFDIEQVKLAISKHTKDPKHGSFFPKIADIIRYLPNKESNIEDKALLAWGQIIREMRRVGAYGSLKLDDRQALAAIKSVKSWKDLCMSPEKDLTWIKKEFLANYKVYENTPLESLPSSLAGLEDLKNHKEESKQGLLKVSEKINQLINKDKNE